MHKAITFLLALAFYSGMVLAATYNVEIYNNNRSQKFNFACITELSPRDCICNAQTGFIKGLNGGTIKLFSSADCTGNFQTLGAYKEAANTQWVNSFSFGLDGYASSGPNGYCPNWYNI
ncbi:hypothetical protein BGX24_004809 [Mortierella sp. AD032]|nr:hypothetical protein BGX24_004809 [Mortierella sp. AD032]